MLRQAVLATPASRLQQVVLKLASSEPRVGKLFWTELIGTKEKVTGKEMATRQKVEMIPRYQTCQYCKEEFDATSKRDQTCRRHNGSSYYPDPKFDLLRGLVIGRLEADYQSEVWERLTAIIIGVNILKVSSGAVVVMMVLVRGA
jgi:hypothetical protein